MGYLFYWKRTKGVNKSDKTRHKTKSLEEIKMQLKGKRVIIIGERDGVQGPAIEECVKSAGAEPVITQTQCFV
jgi:betaine reductase